MKKIYLFFFSLIILFSFSLNVNASTLESYPVFDHDFYSNKDHYKFNDEKIFLENISTLEMMEQYIFNHKEDNNLSCPYYHISTFYDLDYLIGNEYVEAFLMSLYCYDDIPKLHVGGLTVSGYYHAATLIYDLNNSTLDFSSYDINFAPLEIYSFQANNITNDELYLPSIYFDSNYDLYLETNYVYTGSLYENYAPELLNNSLNSVTFKGEILVSDTISLPRYKDKLYSFQDSIYQEINLKDYGAVVAIPKKYQVLKVPIYFQGSVCIDSVYNYGVGKHSNVDTRCTATFVEYEPSYFYIVDDDVKNNSIYYFTANVSEDISKVKINKNYFELYFFTEEEFSNDPTITIDNITYHIKNKSELLDDVGDLCLLENGCSNVEGFDPIGTFWDTTFESFADLLEFIKDSFLGFANSVGTLISLVTVFISELPIPMQSAIYTFFFTSLVIGILKLIL